MVFGFEQSSYDAVLFVDQKTVIKEMLLTEFEAVLDGVVGQPDFADSLCQAVFLKIDRRLNIQGAVFFLIGFDEEGNADRRWNLPLRQLIETAAFGPQINGLPIRVACRSQCQIPWHQQELWEPDLSIESNTLKLLSARIKANRLGLIIDDGLASIKPTALTGSGLLRKEGVRSDSSLDVDCVDPAYRLEQERFKMAQNIKRQRTHLANLKVRFQQELTQLKVGFSKQQEAHLGDLKVLDEKAKVLTEKNSHLSLELEKRNETLEVQRDDFDQQLKKVVNQHGVNHDALSDQYRKLFQQKLIAQTSKLEEKLEMREVEVYYREEQITRLKAEVATARDQCERLKSQNVKTEIANLVEQGVHFVVSPPGLGPISIDSSDLSHFSEDPNRYLANRLGVDNDTFIAWAEHQRIPLCAGDPRTGMDCGASIDSVGSPNEFINGISDRCEKHQRSLTAVNGR